MRRADRAGAFVSIIFAMIALSVYSPAAYPQEAGQSPGQQSENVREFLTLLDKPDVQQWLRSQAATTQAPSVEPARRAGVSAFLASRLVHIRERIRLVGDGAMNFHASLAAAGRRIGDEFSALGTFQAVLQLLSLPLLAAVGSMAFARRRDRAISGADVPLPGQSTLPSLPRLAGFVVGCLLPLLLFPWTDVLKQVAVIIALALIGIRLAIFLGHVCVAALSKRSSAERVGLKGEDGESASFDAARRDAASRHWYRSIVGLISYFLAGWALVELAELLSFSGGARLLLVYFLAFGLFAISLWAVWGRPRIGRAAGRSGAWSSWMWTGGVTLLLFFWLSGFSGLLWIGFFAITLPFVLPFCSKVVRALLDDRPGGSRRISLAQMILLDRGLRAVIVGLSAFWLTRVLGLEAASMATGQTTADRIARGILQGVVVILVADLFWAFAKAQIEARLASASEDTIRSDEEKSRASRLRTLLPILRNVLAAVIGIVAILMVLSGLGIEIAPLLAGAGVVGVAVGFGAQTIVKDVISGMFYLWDDAFRIGEYIETGKYKGTVESFSLRSVKLRHHRGPLTTVPFGELGAVQNMSRDWSVTKFNLRVDYDTDLDALRKVIKKVGQELAERPEYKEHIISPLKMKGVVEFGEYAIEVRVGFTTKPGEQFLIRRDAMTSIRQAFRDNDIHFAVPTVQVSNSEDGDDADVAVAQMLRSREQQKKAAAMEPESG